MECVAIVKKTKIKCTKPAKNGTPYCGVHNPNKAQNPAKHKKTTIQIPPEPCLTYKGTWDTGLINCTTETLGELGVICSSLQTKDWRLTQPWYIDGRHNECEIHQKTAIARCLGLIDKTHDRINLERHFIRDNPEPLTEVDGFDWSEDFDGKVVSKKKTIYFNYKFVCDTGGAQTRTLREVYHFIKNMILVLNSQENTDTIFVNILDGDTSHYHMSKFQYLLEKLHEDKKNCLFVGDSKQFLESFLEKLN